MIYNYNRFLFHLKEQENSSTNPNINPKNLKIGAGGKGNPSQVKDVKALQQKLIDGKFLNIESPTGYFGEKTQAALNKYNANSNKSSGFNLKAPDLRAPAESTMVDTASRDTSIWAFQNFQKVVGGISQRSWNFLDKMKKEGKLKSDSWIIVNKDSALIALFAPNYKFVTSSFIATGKLKDPGIDISEDYKKWWDLSVAWAKKYPDDPESKKITAYLKKYPTWEAYNSKTAIEARNSKKETGFPFSYTASANAGTNFTPSGVYKLGKGRDQNYLVGGSGDPQGKIQGGNSYNLVRTDSGEIIPAAVHGYANKNRADLAEKAKKDYFPFDVTGKIGEETRVGAGCINVDRQFLENMAKFKPSWVVVLPDNKKDAEIKIVQASVFQKTLDSIMAQGKEILNSIWTFFQSK
jgi:peptidoglycan hydrolase-like protein with peptidoglycan-binding domain